MCVQPFYPMCRWNLLFPEGPCMKKELICIACPNGCHLTVEQNGPETRVTGFTCPKGEQYGKEEVTNPKRTVTAVIKTHSMTMPYAPVRTTTALPKPLIGSLLREIYSMHITAPCKRGDVIIQNFQGSGVDVICTRTVPSDAEIS